MPAILILECIDFSSSEFPCLSNSSHQASSDLPFGWQIHLKISEMAFMNDISSTESPCHSDASQQVSAQTDLQFRRRYDLKNFKMVAILDIRTEKN